MHISTKQSNSHLLRRGAGWGLVLVLLSLCGSCTRPRQHTDPASEEFRTETLLPMTPVKDQQDAPLGWAYAMLATIETEHIVRGDSVNLSPAYVARMFLREQVDSRYMQGCSPLGADTLGMTLSGTMPQLVRLIETYGLMPYDSYHTDARLSMAAAKLGWMVDREAAAGKGIAAVRRDADELLDNLINPLPRHVYMYRMEYTPLEFAHSVCMPDEYVAVASASSLPMRRRVALPLKENRDRARFLNMPLDKMMALIRRSLSQGHPVCWEGTAPGGAFSAESGIGDVAASLRHCTPQQRQRAFERQRGSATHSMAIVGTARSKDGRLFFICKDSHGTANPYGGLVYLSADYVRLYTTAVMVNAIVMQQ